MDAAEIVIFDDYSSGRSLDAKWIARTIPARNQYVLHRPTSSSGFCVKFAMRVRETFDTINSLGPANSTSTDQQVADKYKT